MKSILRKCVSHRRPLGIAAFALVAGGLFMFQAILGCAASKGGGQAAREESLSATEKQWGIKIEGIRVTAAGYFVDFRYRVVDPDKAVGLMKRGDKAFVIDQASGMQMPVPLTKVGPLRGTGSAPKADRVYTVMFTSGGGVIRPGSKVTVVIGEFRAENLVVE